MSHPVGIVYLTDGFDRLDLPGRECLFFLDEDWTINGSPCEWVWPHDQPANVAGAEIETNGWFGHHVTVIDVGGLIGKPQIVRRGQPITFTPRIEFEPDNNKERV